MTPPSVPTISVSSFSMLPVLAQQMPGALGISPIYRRDSGELIAHPGLPHLVALDCPREPVMFYSSPPPTGIPGTHFGSCTSFQTLDRSEGISRLCKWVSTNQSNKSSGDRDKTPAQDHSVHLLYDIRQIQPPKKGMKREKTEVSPWPQE